MGSCVPIRTALVGCLLLVTGCRTGHAAVPAATNALATPFVAAAGVSAQSTAHRPTVAPFIVPVPQAESAANGDITIFAATSLADVLNALGVAFNQANPKAHLIFVYGNSTTLASELQQGVKADVFVSAHPTIMDQVSPIVGSIETLARTSLVVITPLDNPAHVTSVMDLANSGVRMVTADPSDAVAKYTHTMLERASADPTYGGDFQFKVQQNVAAQKTTQREMLLAVLLGKADAAIVYASDLTPERRDRLNAIPVPETLTTPVTDPIAVARGNNGDGGRAFVRFVLSETGQDIVAQQGFTRAGS